MITGISSIATFLDIYVKAGAVQRTRGTFPKETGDWPGHFLVPVFPDGRSKLSGCNEGNPANGLGLRPTPITTVGTVNISAQRSNPWPQLRGGGVPTNAPEAQGAGLKPSQVPADPATPPTQSLRFKNRPWATPPGRSADPDPAERTPPPPGKADSYAARALLSLLSSQPFHRLQARRDGTGKPPTRTHQLSARRLSPFSTAARGVPSTVRMRSPVVCSQ